jgi:hypothetical protein
MTDSLPRRALARPRRLAAAVVALGLTTGGVTAGALLVPGATQAAQVDALRTWTGAEGAAAGSAVSQQACDFDGDGQDDIVTSAWMWERAPYDTIGAAYVIPSGAPDGELDDPTTGIVRIEGPQEDSALAAFSVSCAGDVNGDGFDDIILGQFTSSKAWVVFGSDDGQSLSLEFLGDRGFAIERGEGANDRTGYVTTGVGDVDGDGYDDLGIVSLTANDRAGQVSIVRGRDDIATVSLESDEDVLLRIDGGPAQGVSTVARAGDVDGDGVDDLVLGGYVAEPQAGQRAAGMAWVVSGTSRGTVDLTGDFDGFTIEGPARMRDRLGMSVTATGSTTCSSARTRPAGRAAPPWCGAPSRGTSSRPIRRRTAPRSRRAARTAGPGSSTRSTDQAWATRSARSRRGTGGRGRWSSVSSGPIGRSRSTARCWTGRWSTCPRWRTTSTRPSRGRTGTGWGAGSASSTGSAT